MIFKKSILIISIYLALLSEALYGVSPHNSWHHIPSANGICAISFNAKTQVIDQFYPYIFSEWNDTLVVKNLLQYAKFKLQQDGRTQDLSQIPITQLGYLSGTGIIRAEYKHPTQQLISYFWVPMILEFRAMVMILQVKNAKQNRISSDNIGLEYKTRVHFEKIRVAQYNASDLWIAEVLLYPAGLDAEMLAKIRNEVSSAHPLRLLEAEERWWDHWHRNAKVSSSIIGKEYALLQQSAALIKMAQCNIKGAGYGQIVSSLPPGQRNFAHVRDMAYSIVALSKMGHFQEARKALVFMLNAKCGMYENVRFNNKQIGIGNPYQISVYGYFGNGTEKSICNAGLPTICLDNFGLFLWAAHQYVSQSTDLEFVKNFWPLMDKAIALPMAASLSNDGFVRKESGIWELKSPGEHHIYTAATTYVGLNAASFLAHMFGDQEHLEIYSQLAARVRKNILNFFTDDQLRAFKSNFTKSKYPMFVDAATVECINWGVSRPEWKVSRATLDAIEKALPHMDGTGGYGAFIGKSGVPDFESVFINLRYVSALSKMNRNVKAKRLINWIVDQATQNYDQIPEKYTWTTSDYMGAVPAIGLGGAAYIIAVMDMINQ